MKDYAFFKNTGELFGTGRGEEVSFTTHCEENSLTLICTEIDKTQNKLAYYDFAAERVVYVDKVDGLEYDYVLHVWYDPRTLDQAKYQKWSEVKQKRDAVEQGGFLFLGHIFDSDATSQGRIITAEQLGLDTEWTTQNNEIIDITAAQLVELRHALTLHISSCHERGRVARHRIKGAATISEVDTIDY